MKRKPIDWDAQPLGEMTDAELGRRVGVTRERVRQIRDRKGVAPYAETKAKEIEEQLQNLGLVGTIADAKIANFADLPLHSVQAFRKRHRIEAAHSKRQIDWDNIQWEGKSDGEISKLTGISQVIVGRRRREAGIPVQSKSGPGKCLRKGIDWGDHPLGEIPDVELALKMGVSSSTVYTARTRRGIPSSRERRKAKK